MRCTLKRILFSSLSMAGWILAQDAVRAAKPIASPADVAGKLMITELLCTDDYGVADAVEIFNASPVEWDLTNVFVSTLTPDGADTGEQTAQFPNGTTIPPHGMIVVFMDYDVTQEDADQVSTTSLAAPGGVQVFIPEFQAALGLPVAGQTFNGQPVGRFIHHGDDDGGFIGKDGEGVLLGWKATLPAAVYGQPPFPIEATDVIDGFGYIGSDDPGPITWGPGVTDTNALASNDGPFDSFERKADATGTRAAETNSAADWDVDSTPEVSLGSGAWAPEIITSAAQAAGKLLITEVNRSGDNPAIPAECVEIVNNSNRDFMLTNLFLSDNDATTTLDLGDEEGSMSFPPNHVFPAFSTILFYSDKDAPTAASIAAIGENHPNSPGGTILYIAGAPVDGDPPLSDPAFAFNGRAPLPVVYHPQPDEFDEGLAFENGADNVVLGVKTDLVPGVDFGHAPSQVIDGMGYYVGEPLEDTVAWSGAVTTFNDALLVQTVEETEANSFRRIAKLDTDAAADWEIGASTPSTPGHPDFMLDGLAGAPNAARGWTMFE